MEHTNARRRECVLLQELQHTRIHVHTANKRFLGAHQRESLHFTIAETIYILIKKNLCNNNKMFFFYFLDATVYNAGIYP